MTASHRGILLAGLALVAGCSGPITPTPSVVAGTPIPTPQSSFIEALPFSGPSRTFVFDRELSYPVSPATKGSLWILYDNGAFDLRFPGWSAGGVYRVDDGVFGCQFVSPNQGAVFAAFPTCGGLEGDVLTIDWDEFAEQADWQDAVYVLRP